MAEELNESMGLDSANSGDALIEFEVNIEYSVVSVGLRRRCAGLQCETASGFVM